MIDKLVNMSKSFACIKMLMMPFISMFELLTLTLSVTCGLFEKHLQLGSYLGHEAVVVNTIYVQLFSWDL